MKIISINCNPNAGTSRISNATPNFNANLWVEKSVSEVIQPNSDVFLKAARKYGEWLQTVQSQIRGTMTIRKNTASNPLIAFTHIEPGIVYAGRISSRFEDLEFEFENKKSGFWFDKNSNENKLFEDFKNMFNYLHNN